nr:sodium:solute symporter [Bacteroidales bacterium]
VDGVLDTWWKLASIFSGGMLGLFLLGFICKKVNKMAAVLGVIAGLLVIFWMSLSQYLFTGAWEPYQCHLNGNLTIVIGTVVIFVIGFLFTWLFKNKASMSKN